MTRLDLSTERKFSNPYPREWKSGPPPHSGWWLTGDGWWRWWDGFLQLWSHGVKAGATLRTVRRSAIKTCEPLISAEIVWTDRWPENARVPRLDPTGGHWTFNTTGEGPADRPDAWHNRVEVVLRSGIRLKGFSRDYLWGIDGDPGDIVAWRRTR